MQSPVCIVDRAQQVVKVDVKGRRRVDGSTDTEVMLRNGGHIWLQAVLFIRCLGGVRPLVRPLILHTSGREVETASNLCHVIVQELEDEEEQN